MQPVGDQRSENSNVARSRDVNHVRLEPIHVLLNFAESRKHGKVKRVRSVEPKSNRPAANLNPLYAAIARDFISRTSMHHQKRQASASRKRLKLPARVGDAVYFVIRIGKKRDPQVCSVHEVASYETSVATRPTVSLGIACVSAFFTAVYSSSRNDEKRISRNTGGVPHNVETGVSSGVLRPG